MIVVVAISLFLIAMAAWTFAGDGTERFFYCLMGIGITSALLARVIWRCPFCNVWLGKGWAKTLCPKCGQTFASNIADTDNNAHNE
jgi:hypothetical protein